MTRVIIGWLAVLILAITQQFLAPPVPGVILVLVLAGVVVIISICSFGVVTQAEKLAQRMGDPYGSLVLTISIVLIEVILISAVMLGPGDHTTIGRDSVMAVSMIIMNLVIGIAVRSEEEHTSELQSRGHLVCRLLLETTKDRD